MDQNIKDNFTEKWRKYFHNAELPVAYFYADEIKEEVSYKPSSFHCIFDEFSRARSGETLVFSADTPMCAGGKRYMGFSTTLRANFDYFLSCGIPGKVKGERYKKSPEIVNEIMKGQPPVPAPGRYIVFKRWDKLTTNDNPDAVVFFAVPDVLSGLFTLANFDEVDRNAVITPFGSGCSSVVYYPMIECRSENQRAVMGMFDVSARPYVNSAELTITIPYPKFLRMINNMDESFLITGSWEVIADRIKDGIV